MESCPSKLLLSPSILSDPRPTFDSSPLPETFLIICCWISVLEFISIVSFAYSAILTLPPTNESSLPSAVYLSSPAETLRVPSISLLFPLRDRVPAPVLLNVPLPSALVARPLLIIFLSDTSNVTVLFAI